MSNSHVTWHCQVYPLCFASSPSFFTFFLPFDSTALSFVLFLCNLCPSFEPKNVSTFAFPPPFGLFVDRPTNNTPKKTNNPQFMGTFSAPSACHTMGTPICNAWRLNSLLFNSFSPTTMAGMLTIAQSRPVTTIPGSSPTLKLFFLGGRSTIYPH